MIWIVLGIVAAVLVVLVLRARRETSLDDVPDAEAARNAMAAGFDGVDHLPAGR